MHGRNWRNRRDYDGTRSLRHCFRNVIEVTDRSARHSEAGGAGIDGQVTRRSAGFAARPSPTITV